VFQPQKKPLTSYYFLCDGAAPVPEKTDKGLNSLTICKVRDAEPLVESSEPDSPKDVDIHDTRQRQSRNNRWVLKFATKNGRQYAAQLAALGAILVIPQGENHCLVIRNLDRPQMKQEKIAAIKGKGQIVWIDDKPQSVEGLLLALGIKLVPRTSVLTSLRRWRTNSA
jgi:hypothetical protein